MTTRDSSDCREQTLIRNKNVLIQHSRTMYYDWERQQVMNMKQDCYALRSVVLHQRIITSSSLFIGKYWYVFHYAAAGIQVMPIFGYYCSQGIHLGKIDVTFMNDIRLFNLFNMLCRVGATYLQHASKIESNHTLTTQWYFRDSRCHGRHIQIYCRRSHTQIA